MSNRDQPLVSVIMNCYNGEKYLREAIDSIYAQTYKNWEIIFWDNCSIDRSAVIAQSYGKKIKYFYGEENIPLGGARNKAIKQTNGIYITFLDCDDLYLKNTLELLVNKIENTGFNFCYGGINQIDLNGKIINKFTPNNKDGYSLPYLLENFNINVPSCIINKKFLNENKLNFDDEFFASEEYNLFMKIATLSKGMGIINQPISHYRVYQNSLTNKSMKYWANERESTLNQLLIIDNELQNKYPVQFKKAFAQACYYSARWEMEKKQRLKAIKKIMPIIFIDIRYLLFLILLLFPRFIYNQFIKMYYKR